MIDNRQPCRWQGQNTKITGCLGKQMVGDKIKKMTGCLAVHMARTKIHNDILPWSTDGNG